jgi:hypothetical protein
MVKSYQPKFEESVYKNLKEVNYVINSCGECSLYSPKSKSCKFAAKVIKEYGKGEYKEWVSKPEYENSCKFFESIEK